jgi:hypothetical protein
MHSLVCLMTVRELMHGSLPVDRQVTRKRKQQVQIATNCNYSRLYDACSHQTLGHSPFVMTLPHIVGCFKDIQHSADDNTRATLLVHT